VKSIYVGNLDFGATEDSVRALFEPFGAVDRVNIIKDRDTGQSRGFAFVEMADGADADRAIAALNGSNFSGRRLTVNEARPRADRAGAAGSGGGGGTRGSRPSGGGSRRQPRW
jgi:RNA recognition motif-containing protein